MTSQKTMAWIFPNMDWTCRCTRKTTTIWKKKQCFGFLSVPKITIKIGWCEPPPPHCSFACHLVGKMVIHFSGLLITFNAAQIYSQKLTVRTCLPKRKLIFEQPQCFRCYICPLHSIFEVPKNKHPTKRWGEKFTAPRPPRLASQNDSPW